LALKKVYAVFAVVIIVVAAVGFYFFILPPSYRVAEGEANIGKSGGCVYDGGANVTVPEGALDRDILIAVKLLNVSTIPAPPPPLTTFLGAASFGPDGTSFKKNVTITIPLRESKTAGTRLPLFVYNQSKKAFVETDTMAVVNPDGKTASATVDHFSTGGLFDGVTGEGLKGAFEGGLDSGLTPKQSFDSVVQSVLESAKLGECDIESRLECPKVVGVLISIMYETDVPTDDYSDAVSIGETRPAASYITVGADKSEWVSNGEEHYMIYSLVVEVYIDYVQPKIGIPQTVIVLEQGESVVVSAYLECCAALPDRNVEFHLSPLFGSISPTSDTTDGNGVAETTYTAPDEEGTATLTVMYTFQTYEETGTEVYQEPRFGKSILKQKYEEKTTTIGDSVTLVVSKEYKVHIDQTVPWGPIVGWAGEPYQVTMWGTFRLILDASSEGGLYGNWKGTCSLYMVTEGEGPTGHLKRENWIWEDSPVSFSLPEGGGSFPINPTEGILTGYFDPSSNTIKVTVIQPLMEIFSCTGTFEGVIVPKGDC